MVLWNVTKVQIAIACLVFMKLVVCQEDSDTDSDVAVTNTDESPEAARCMKKRTGCCEELNIGDTDAMVKCLTLHQSKIPAEGETDPGKLIKFMSCFVECQYKQKKYIGKGDTINMKMVRSDAAKMFSDRPKEKDHHIALFEHCKKDALTMYNLVKMNPAGKIMLREACRPFFMFVFLCQAEYHKKITCPYFTWAGKENTPAASSCAEERAKCYEIDGISI